MIRYSLLSTDDWFTIVRTTDDLRLLALVVRPTKYSEINARSREKEEDNTIISQANKLNNKPRGV